MHGCLTLSTITKPQEPIPMASARDQIQKKPSSSKFNCRYQVFLSFRGKDTRSGFASHLHRALKQAGIHTFRDDEEMARGEEVKEELVRAIHNSKILIIVFSKNYGFSSWCLDEALSIMERMKTTGQKVLPVFYRVQPDQVREQSGSFAESFAKHEKEEKEKVEKWREALREAASLAGMVSQDKDEARFVEDIVKHVEHMLNHKALRVPSHLVGIDPHVEVINSWVSDWSTDSSILILHGLGGVGKTTLAKVVYNINYGAFDGSSFVAEIRKGAAEPRGLIRMQRQILKDILRAKKEDINNVDEGIIKIQEAICCRKVLIILDDVGLKDHLDSIIAIEEGSFHGSKIIITTRDVNILRNCRQIWTYKVNELDHKKSLALFSWHAFGEESPLRTCKRYSELVVNHCGGLPLALEVLGSSLSGKNEEVWKSAIQNLRLVDPDKKIEKILRISFDSLSHHHDQNVFLDVVCFFVGKDVNYALTILEGCGYQARYRLKILIERSLLTIDKHNKLMAHQLLQDMGREIICQESIENHAKRSRIWHENAYDVLREKSGTETIKGLALNIPMLMEHGDVKARVLEKPKRHRDEDSFGKSTTFCRRNYSKRRRLRLFPWQAVNFLFSSVQNQNEVEFETEAFGKMSRLKLIKLEYVSTRGCFEKFPKRLIWLFWRGFPLESIPNDFYLDNLVALDMRQSSLKQVWKCTRVLENLKILNLNHSHSLQQTPNFYGLPSIEILKMKDCINLLEVHESITKLKTLFQLDLKDCKSLKNLPRGFHMLKSLETLILSGCGNLHFYEVMDEIGKMESLKVLNADGIPINRKENVTRNERLWHFWTWRLPRAIPEFAKFSLAGLPRSLVQLTLSNCNLSDDMMPSDLTCLPMLEVLDLRGNLFHILPTNFMTLHKLRSIDISDCKELQIFPPVPSSIGFVNMANSTSLDIVSTPQKLMAPLQLDFFDVQNSVAEPGLFRLKSIIETDVKIIKNIELFNLDLDSIGSTHIFLHSLLSMATCKCSQQRLYECGIYSIFVHGSEVPHWYDTVCDTGSVLYTSMPLRPISRIQALNICVAYDCPEGFPPNPYLSSYGCLEVCNDTKKLRWIYRPTAFGFHNESNMLWLSHWQNIGNQLEEGDEVRVLVDFPSKYRTKKIGIHLLYQKERIEDEKLLETDKILVQNCSSVDVSAYYIGDGIYDLCNFTLQAMHEEIRKLGSTKLCRFEYLKSV